MVTRRVLLILFDGCEVLDAAGPLQAFHEANDHGCTYKLGYYGPMPLARTSQGLVFAEIGPLPAAAKGDLVLVPGFPVMSAKAPRPVVSWLRQAWRNGATICSVCTGAFVLGEAGILNGKQCTTHWKRVEELQTRYPSASVLTDRLYVEDDGIVTSAGIASGIDMALALIEKDCGPKVTAKIARELVVYLRRDSSHSQQSAYLEYRTHLHPGIHAVQDWLTNHLTEKGSLEEIASIAGMSVRNLTRAFREATGISIHAYRLRLRLEHARTLLHDPSLTLEAIAAQSGLGGERQLRRAWHSAFGYSPAEERRKRISYLASVSKTETNTR